MGSTLFSLVDPIFSLIPETRSQAWRLRSFTEHRLSGPSIWARCSDHKSCWTSAPPFVTRAFRRKRRAFPPSRKRPSNKNVIVGCISTKLRELEDKEETKRRIYKA